MCGDFAYGHKGVPGSPILGGDVQQVGVRQGIPCEKVCMSHMVSVRRAMYIELVL